MVGPFSRFDDTSSSTETNQKDSNLWHELIENLHNLIAKVIIIALFIFLIFYVFDSEKVSDIIGTGSLLLISIFAVIILMLVTVSIFDKIDGDLKKGIIVASVGAFIAFSATLCQTIMPIYFSSDSSDFSIIVHPVNIEPTYLETGVSPSLLQILNPFVTVNASTITPAIVEVKNVHNTINPYRHSVYLKIYSDNPNIFVLFDKLEGEPSNFTSKMYVYIKALNKSIVNYPMIIQGIGGNGKIRNCTFYVTYITPEDYVKRGNNQSTMGRYIEADESYDKAIELKPDYAQAWNNKGSALYFIGKYEEAFQDFNKSLNLGLKNDSGVWNNKGICSNCPE